MAYDGNDPPPEQSDNAAARDKENAFARAFGLERSAFSVSLQTDFLFLSSIHQEVLASLVWGIEQERSIVCLVGEVGTGKSLLLAALRERLEPKRTVISLRHSPTTSNELLRMILQELAVDDRKLTRVERLYKLDAALQAASRTRMACPVLIVDEAQRLPLRLFEEIRLFSNLESGSRRLLQVLIAGQPELDRKLQQHNLRQFTQRIAVRARLVPLTKPESFDLVRHRLRQAGRHEGEPPLFTRAALETIYEASQGVPRIIVALCDQSLLAAFGDYRQQVDEELVRRSIELLEITPLPNRLRASVTTLPLPKGEAAQADESTPDLRLVRGARGAKSEGAAEDGDGAQTDGGDSQSPTVSPPEGKPPSSASRPPKRGALETASLSREALFLKVHARLRGVELLNEVAQELAAGASDDYGELNGIIDRLVEMADSRDSALSAETVRQAIGPGESTTDDDSDSSADVEEA